MPITVATHEAPAFLTLTASGKWPELFEDPAAARDWLTQQ